MSNYFRQSRYCSELDRTAEELIAYDRIPRAERPRRFQTHKLAGTDKYVRACAEFAGHNQRLGRPSLLRSPERAADLIIDFVQQLRSGGRTVCAILDILTAINTWYFTRDLPRPGSRKLSAFTASLRKEHTVVRATPASPEHVKGMCRQAILTRSPLAAARDQALLLDAFTSAERPMELRTMRVEDLEFDLPRGMRIRIPQSKGDQEGEGQYVTITVARDRSYCPVHKTLDWLKASGITSGIVFRTIDRHGNIGPDRPMSHTAYDTLMKSYLRSVGLAGRLSGYSMRRGYATTAHDYGASKNEIGKQLRHKHDSTTEIYVDRRPIPFERSITGVLLS
jgi:integrase